MDMNTSTFLSFVPCRACTRRPTRTDTPELFILRIPALLWYSILYGYFHSEEKGQVSVMNKEWNS